MSVYFRKRKDGTKAWYYCFEYNGTRYRKYAGTTKTQALRNEEKNRAEVISGRYDLKKEIKNPMFEGFVKTFLICK